jgi:hypothetical protein
MEPTTTTTTLSVPSLDHIASRTELRNPPPHTPARQPNPRAFVWDNMPSSPLGPSDTFETVQEREKAYVEFGRQRVKAKGRRTLEWACASARVAGSGGKENVDISGDVGMALDLDIDEIGEGDEEDETDEEVHEAVTPDSSFGPGVGTVGGISGSKATLMADEMMAAYVLCGLGLGLR